MAQFLENFPEYKKQAGNVAKHVSIMSEIQRCVDSRKLMTVSALEQELACTAGQLAAFEVPVAPRKFPFALVFHVRCFVFRE